MLLQQHTAALFVVACVSAIVALAARFLRRTTLPTSSKRNPNAPLSPAHRAQLLQGSRQRAGAVSVMLEWMGWSAGSAGKQANKKQLSPAEKLRGYHELAKARARPWLCQLRLGPPEVKSSPAGGVGAPTPAAQTSPRACAGRPGACIPGRHLRAA